MNTVQEKNIGQAETDLFNPNILDRIPLVRLDGLLIRPLKSGDYDRGFLQLLSQLTEIGNVSREQFLNTFHRMKSTNGYYIVVIEDLSIGKVIASATLVVEQKFIHNCSVRGHLEDVVVNNNYRGKHLGKLIVKIIMQLARYLRCYKLSLECQDHLIAFYESIGFKREPKNANSLNLRLYNENTAEQSHL